MIASTSAGSAPPPVSGGSTESGPVRLRKALVRLGPTFVKLGQYLAMRPDVLPQEYCDEMLELVDRVPSFAWPEAQRILTEELGAPPEEVYAFFPRQPVAAGSLAQVYMARTHDGDAVAVKVRRPGLEARVRIDLRRMRWVLRGLEISGVLIGIAPGQLLDELERWLLEELDFDRELRNLTRMQELYGNDPEMRVPRPFPELSSRRVLTAEFLEGLPLSEVVRQIRAGRDDRLEASGVDRDALARNLLGALLHQIFRDNFFHADTHPGNLIALSDQRIGFVDFGLVDRLDTGVRQGMTRYVAALFSGDMDKIFHSLSEVLTVSEGSNLAAFRREFDEVARVWSRERDGGDSGAAGSPEGSASGSPLGRFMIGVVQAARRHGLGIPPATLSMYRSLLVGETVARQVGKGSDLLSVGRSFFQYLQFHEVLRSLHPEQLQGAAIDVLSLFRDTPGELIRLLGQLSEDRIPFTVRTEASPEDRQLEGIKAKMVTLATASVGLAMLWAPARDITLWGGWSGAHAVGVGLGLLYLWLVFLWRRLP